MELEEIKREVERKNEHTDNDVTLVFMAAGLGSRFGGNKQLAALGPKGQSLMAYTAYDAVKIGYRKLIFILRKGMEKEFMSVLGNDLLKAIPMEIVLQDMEILPEGISIPDERVKPLGTGHALYCVKDRITGPFVILNADDLYGRGVLEDLHEALKKGESMVIPGYPIKNTLSDKGSVSRGILSVNSKGYLVSIKEKEKIWMEDREIMTFNEKDVVPLEDNTLVSMNIWGMQREVLSGLDQVFTAFLRKEGRDLLKDEFYLPEAMDELRKIKGVDLRIIDAKDNWMGVTYADDAKEVSKALKDMVHKGIYPESLFGE